MNRYQYITNAYQSMATWMNQGNDAAKKLKRYIHRNLKLPSTLRGIDPDDAADIMHHFGWHYVDALLTYCSDNLKPSKLTFYSTLHAWLVGHPNPNPNTIHSDHYILRAKTSSEFRSIPVGKVRVHTPHASLHCVPA